MGLCEEIGKSSGVCLDPHESTTDLVVSCSDSGLSLTEGPGEKSTKVQFSGVFFFLMQVLRSDRKVHFFSLWQMTMTNNFVTSLCLLDCFISDPTYNLF